MRDQLIELAFLARLTSVLRCHTLDSLAKPGTSGRRVTVSRTIWRSWSPIHVLDGRWCGDLDLFGLKETAPRIELRAFSFSRLNQRADLQVDVASGVKS